MSQNQKARYPSHLSRLVAARLRERGLEPPADKALLQLLEALYFASLKTDEGRPCLCTVNYVDPQHDSAGTTDQAAPAGDVGSQAWTTVRFRQPLPLNVRTLRKLAEAADPTVSSLAVFSDDHGEMFVWGMVDQELRYADYVSQDSAPQPRRPGLFQATITGVGNISVYKDYALLGSLDQHSLVAAYHDVLWDGPVHARLKENLLATLTDDPNATVDTAHVGDVAQVKDELLVRWQNAVCRLLLNIQQYGHGGGVLIVPRCPPEKVNIKYQLRYNRLPEALFGLAKHQFLKRQTADSVAQHCRTPADVLPCDIHFDALAYQGKLEKYKNEALGCVKFIASLSRVDGFVLLDRSLVVHGFGVEARADGDLTDVYVATDVQATPRLLRQATLSQFGTRHRAMLRYCHEYDGALGFVISQDGDIRATMKVDDRLILWENINLQIGFRRENHAATFSNIEPMTVLFQFWSQSLSSLRSA